MPLTLKEKEHWKKQIEKRIEKAISRVYRNEKKGWKTSLLEKAKSTALKALELEQYMERHSSLGAQISQLEEEMSNLSIATAKAFEDDQDPFKQRFSAHRFIERVVEQETEIREKDLLKESKAGRKILRLKREKEELLDTIWLATSPAQIRSLWSDFTSLISAEPTDMQKQAMTYMPEDCK